MEQFVIGFTRAPHGLSGKLKIDSASGEYAHFSALKEVTLRKGSDEKRYVVEYVENLENAEDGAGSAYIKIAGIDSPEDAKKISGRQIVVPREFACPLHDGQYYVEDMKQCAVICREDDANSGVNPSPVGVVTDVIEGGAGNLLEVALSELDDCGKTRTVLIPFSKEFVGRVDIEHKQLELLHRWILE